MQKIEIIILTIVLSIMIGALLYRLRGGLFSDLTGLKQPTQISRLLWSGPTAAFICFMHVLPVWMPYILTTSVFASMAWIGNGDYLDPKRKQPIIDLVGLLRNGIAIAPVAYFTPIPAAIYLFTGAAHAQLYRLSHYLTGQSQWAELMIGGLTWMTIAIVWN